MEGRLSNGEDIAEVFESGDIRVFILGIGDDEVDVDDVLGRQPLDGGRADVLDVQCRLAQRCADFRRQGLVAARPFGVVRGDGDRLGRRRAVDPGILGRVGVAVSGDVFKPGIRRKVAVPGG